MFGTYTGYIYALRLNGSDHQATEEDIINFHFYPFEPVIAITESPRAVIYFGGYNIYNLELVNPGAKIQVGYPLTIDVSGRASVKGVIYDETSHLLSVQIGKQSENPTDFSSSNIKIEVPNGLLNITNTQIKFMNGSSVSIYKGSNETNWPSSTRMVTSETKDLTTFDLNIGTKVESVNFRGT